MVMFAVEIKMGIPEIRKLVDMFVIADCTTWQTKAAHHTEIARQSRVCLVFFYTNLFWSLIKQAGS
jgi:hypothetical protein